MARRFTVRQIQLDDIFLASYRELRIELWPDCRNDCDYEMTQILSDPAGWAVFVALVDSQKAIGFLEVSLLPYAEGANSSPVAFIEGWLVIAEHRRQGIGRMLVKAAEEWAVSRSCHEIGSDTPIENSLSIAAHQRLGYQEVERLVCFLKRLGP